MSVIRADYLTASGERHLCAGAGHGWEWTVTACPPGTYWTGPDHVRLRHYGADGSRSVLLRPTPEFLAFCAGGMPPYVFADWLEENVPDLPEGVLELLRLPVKLEPVYTDGKDLSVFTG